MEDDRRVSLGITLPEPVLNTVDEMRGLIPRTRFLEALIVEGLERRGITNKVDSNGNKVV
jgi:hypothetical protein